MEEELRRALRRKQPSADFTKRVIEQIIRGTRTEARGHWTHWRTVAAALTLVVLLGGWAAHTVAERRAGERAKDEVLLALRIAGAKVRYAQNQVHDIGRK